MAHTVVQHSGCGYSGNPQFEKGLEPRHVATKADANRVKIAGGLLFESYAEADAFCDKAMYPEGYGGLTPNAQGSFSDQEIDGLKIYIPLVEVRG